MSALIFSQAAAAQQMRSVAVEGYITVVNLPGSFDVNRMHVTLRPDTGFGLEKDKVFRTDSPLRNEIRVGAYVWVLGPYSDRHKTATANTILFRDDWDKALEGTGVIDKVVSAGPEPVFRADGYDIRITPKTETSFLGTLKTMHDVSTNAWLHYEGTRDKDGVLVASKAQFIPPKATRFKFLKGWELTDLDFHPPKSGLKTRSASNSNAQLPYDVSDQDSVLTEDGYIKLGILGHIHKIPSDNALQARVRHVGMRLVPKYQKLLPSNSPSKMHFHFYAYDDKKLRSELCANDGLILVPVQVVERLKNDDQLAAVLADGVAFNLQRQMARIVADNRALLGTLVAGDVAMFFIPGAGVAALVGYNKAENKIMTEMEEQRGRIALSLMADAGYDPWQAPEAWRLLAPKNLPKNLDSLKYPDLSGYQLSILNLQYGKTAGTAQAALPESKAVGAK